MSSEQTPQPESMTQALMGSGIDFTTAPKSIVPNYKLGDYETSNGHSEGKFVELTLAGIEVLCGDQSVPPGLQRVLKTLESVKLIEKSSAYTENKSKDLLSVIEQMKILG